jgi:hypothetical protein
MAKIGATSNSPGSQPFDKNGTGIGSVPQGDTMASSGTPGTFGASFLKLKDQLAAVYDDQFGAAYAGSFNSETASMEIRTDIFDSCDHHEEFIVSCDTCGRRPGNNISLLTGRGDGVYAGLNYSYSNDEMDAQERIGEHLASLYLFDQDIACAQSLIRSGWAQPEPLFIQHSAIYSELKGSVAGEVHTGADGFWVSDRSAHPGSKDVCVDHLGSENKTYVVVVFHEPIEESKMYYSPSAGEPAVDSEGKLKTPVRPRVVMIIDKQFATTVFGDFSDFSPVPWEEQPHLWMNMIVASNASADNGLLGIVNDGMFWKNVLDRQAQISDEDFWINRQYRVQALGYFLQSALLGDQSSREPARDLIARTGSAPLTVKDAEQALRIRAQRFDDNARALTQELMGGGL